MANTEPNQVKWRGIRLAAGESFLPVAHYAEEGTQVTKSDQAAGGATTIHTVTTGKKLLLSSWNLCGQGAAGGVISLYVTNAADVLQYRFACLAYPAGAGVTSPNSAPMPVPIPAGYKIKAESSAAGITASGFIHGFEVDA